MTKKNGTKEKSQYATVTPDQVPVHKIFLLVRNEDESGVSSTGIVAVGMMYPSGCCYMEWTTPIKSENRYNSIADLEAIHGHKGKTVVQWLEK